MEVKEAIEITGGLSHTTKMPCASFSLPAHNCAFGVQQGWVKVKNSICSHCYARKGRYLFPNVKKCLEKRLEGLKHPQWVEAMTLLIKQDKSDFFRWHDSGEIQDMEHLLAIIQVVKATPEKKHWLPTKQIRLIELWLLENDETLPENLTIRLSSPICGCQPTLKDSTWAVEGVTGCLVDKTTPAWFAYTETIGKKICPAIADKTGKCGDCRACWDRDMAFVLYPMH